MILYMRLGIYALVSVAVSFLVTSFRVSVWILDGLHTYIYPENLAKDPSKIRAVIKRPGMYNQEEENDHKPRSKKKKDKSEFDEANAQVYRLRLGESQIHTREYFHEYDEAFMYASLSLSNLVVSQFLPECSAVAKDKPTTILFSGDLIPLLVGFYAVYKFIRLLGRISLEKSSSKKSEKIVSIFVGVLGFVISLTVLYVLMPGLVDLKFRINENVGENLAFLSYVKFALAVFSGWLAGILFIPAHKCVRSFWLATDQLNWNLAILSSGKITRTLMYLNVAMPVFTSLLWVKPMASVFVLEPQQVARNNYQKQCAAVNGLELEHQFSECSKLLKSSNEESAKIETVQSFSSVGEGDNKWYSWINFYTSQHESWTKNIGFHPTTFEEFRLCCLLFTALLQLVLMRSNLQMYLNEAVMSWYQRLHTSKVPDMDFSLAKLFLHNHFVCQVALQFFIPGTMTLLFLGLSQLKESSFRGMSLIESFPSISLTIKDVAIYIAWWVQAVWVVLTCSNLSLYRHGLLIVS